MSYFGKTVRGQCDFGYPDDWQAGLRISPKHPDVRQEDLRRRAAATQTHISPERSCPSAVYYHLYSSLNILLDRSPPGRSIIDCPVRFRVDLHALGQLDYMDDGQWQSDGPVRRGGVTDPELLNDSESSCRPDENKNRLVEEAEEVEQGPRGGQRFLRHDNTNNNGESEDFDSSKLDDDEDNEDEEEEMDSTSGVYSPELDGHIRDSPTPSPSPTVSEGLVSPEGTMHNDVASPHGFMSPLAVTLQDLGVQGDHPLLPQCLHQIAEAFMCEEDYERAVRFIQLERLYHERVLSNLTAIQEQWERSWSLIGGCQDVRESRSDLDAEHLEKLRHICRTHRQPAQSAEKCAVVSKVQRNSVIREEPPEDLNSQQLLCSSGEFISPITVQITSNGP
ncbi:Consortin [Triplophysa tibetana]|uniref:Consortin n=1 Tax=Triplophysa tibetana TaxID=1572043 RepID=A0A5A9NPK9_9TELE|nr:Consortin [Triplophysa tibetana]